MKTWTTYKKQIASRYIPIALQDVGMRMLESDVMHLSVKLDGHLAFLHSDGQSCWLTNSGNERWDDLPLLTEAAAQLKGISCVLAGELHVVAEGRTYGFQVPSALAKQPDSLAFGVFDLLSYDGGEWSDTWSATFAKINSLLSEEGKVFGVPQLEVSSRAEIESFFEKTVTQGGAEGMVVRHEGGPTYKLKSSIDVDVVVLGYAEATGEESGQLRELLVGLAVDESTYQILGQVGNGLSLEERKGLLGEFKDEHTPSDYVEVSGDNVAFTMIPPKTVFQIRCLDVIAENARGAIHKPRLVWTLEGYTYQLMAPAASMIAPVIEGIRTDKDPTPEEAGMGQLERIVGEMSKADTTESLPESQLLRREVYVKESKGVKSVRKFLAWKTNKEQSGQYPPYILSFTDYSPTRKDPMKRDLSIAKTEDGLQALFEEQLAANVKKGWEKIQ